MTTNKGALRLRLLRMELGLTQLAVAHRLGMSQAKYWQIEHGYVIPTANERERLAKILRVGVEDLGLAKAS